MTQEKLSKLDPFEAHGVEFFSESQGQAQGECPFCGKRKFYVRVETGQWDCKVCFKGGNVYTFLEDIAMAHHAETSKRDWKWLEHDRQLPKKAFKPWKMGWDGSTWLIPAFSPRGHALDVRIYEPGRRRVISTAGCRTQLLGLHWLAEAPPGSEVWVCEGEWDAIALRWIFHLSGQKEQIVVGVPGAGIFKDTWSSHFDGMNVRLCYDNDGPGEHGATRAASKLQSLAREMKVVRWPKMHSKGFDIRDFILERRKAGDKAGIITKKLRRLLVDVDEEQLEDGHASPGTVSNVIKIGSVKNPPTFADTTKVFKKWIALDPGMEDALKICYAHAFSVDVPGDPLWTYLVGPAGSGKTLLLVTLAGSERCLFRSTVGPKSLVSGFRADKDPSELPKWDGHCAVLKDFTELLSENIHAREEVFGTLRGAYDGSVERPFGNGVMRVYKNLHFALLAGVTPAIHNDNKASLGERFLKFDIMRQQGWAVIEGKVRAAVATIARENDMEAALAEASGRFLSRKIDPKKLPSVPVWVIDRVVALAQLIASLRAVVEREAWGEQRLKYRPSQEIGTRLAKQMIKLGQLLAFVDGKKAIGNEQYRLIERVGFDTAIGFHLEVVSAMMEFNGVASRVDLMSRLHGLPYTNLGRALDDLEALGVVRKLKSPSKVAIGPGRTSTQWKLSDRLVDLWTRAKVGEAAKHVERIVKVRRRRTSGGTVKVKTESKKAVRQGSKKVLKVLKVRKRK